jgi:type II secretory pathway pseudopilin PulG
MNANSQSARCSRKNEQGYVLLAVMLLVTLLLIALAIEAPRLAQQVKREREEELIHRGQEYSRAIKKFYIASGGRYPTSLEQLENTNNKRFLRKRYKDPITGKDDWRIIHVGEAHLNLTPNGQPVTGDQNNSTQPGNNSSSGSSNSSTSGNSGFSTSTGGSGLSGVGLGSGSSNSSGTNSTNTQPGNAQSGQMNSQPLGSFGSGQTFGGQIIGVASSSTDESIKELKGKNHYNDWEFVYDPRLDRPGGNGIINTNGRQDNGLNGPGSNSSGSSGSSAKPPQ